jgi:isochorismate pyruvate lyase
MNTAPTDGRPGAGSLQDVRDAIDRDIVRLMAERGAEVKRAARFKTTPAGVAAPHRVEEVVARVRALATRSGLSPRVAEAAYRPMIAAFIAIEHEAFAAQQASDAERPEASGLPLAPP